MITHNEYIKKNPEKTLQKVREAIISFDKKQVGSGQARGFFVETDIWRKLRTIQSDLAHPLFSLADATIVTASDASSYFGLDPATSDGMGNIHGANTLVSAAIMTTEQLNDFLSKSVSISQPFSQLSLLKYNQAKAIFTEKIVDNYHGQNIKITLNDVLPENCTITTLSHDEFGYENFGKVAHLNTSDKVYKLKTDNKQASKLFVRIPFADFDYTVELI